MLKNVAGVWFEGKPATDEWVVRTLDLGNGHKEAVISRPTVWEEMPPHLSALFGEHWEASALRDREEQEEERKLANLKRAARRAKTRVRRTVKVLGLDAMLTLTYRANQTDLSLCKKHMKEFVRRMRRALPGFCYVAAFEPQKRGAWHVHMAIHALPRDLAACNGVKVKSFNVVRAIWRSVVGELGGNIDQAKRKRSSRQSVGKLAAYLSKYMLKAFEEGDDWSNRYSGSAGVEIPDAVRMRFRDAQLAELIGLVFDEVAAGVVEVSTWLSRWGDVFYMSTESPPMRPLQPSSGA
ncbi:MAG: hypothetical protein EOO80_00980 [Oxalobacteraceae bacterium]|nr:MAG: hypothetical protein EOO80_00980 [Oxalobacteraceae bacterium]